MSFIRKPLGLLLAVTMLFSVIPAFSVFAETALTQLESIEGTTRIGIFGDSHVGNENGSKKTEETLKTFAKLDPDYDGLALTGDVIVQYGTVADDYKVDSAPYDFVLSDLNTYAQGKPYSWNMGNHEFPGACVLKTATTDAQRSLMETAIATSKEYYVEKTGMSLNDDVIIGGYHFISAAPIDYSNCFDAQAESYIMERIDEAIEADGNEKPIFLNIHHAPWYTSLSSTETVYDMPYSETLTDYLSQHPNVIIFTGHTHNSEYDPRTIWQGGYTVVNVGHTSNGGGATITGEAVYDRSGSQEAIMMEIDKNNVVTLKRIDVTNQCYIGEDWVLDIPNMVKNPNNTDYWKYTDTRYDQAPTPYFEEGAKITQVSSTLTTGTVSFPQAKVDTFMGDDIIRYYEVKVVNKKLQTLVQDYNIAADFYTAPSKRANPFVFKIDELDASTTYAVQVTAVSPYGKKSETISGEFTTLENSSETTTVATTPENDPRDPIYKYVATTDDSGNVVTQYEELNTPGRNSKGYNKDGRFGFGNYYVAMYESGNYITYELEVEEAGLYELMGIGANTNSSDMAVYIDGFKKGIFTVPVNSSGSYGPAYDATYASAGEYMLEAGTHTIKFMLEEQAKSQLLFWGTALAKVEDAYVDYMYCTEGTPIAGHFADYSASKDVMAYQFYGDGWGYIDFTVTVPTNGEYILNAETGGAKEGNTFAVFVDSFPSSYNTSTATTFIDIPLISSPVLNTIVSCPANDTLKLSAGTHKIRLWAGKTCAPYLRSITLVNYDMSDKWSVYHTSSDSVKAFANGGSGDNDLSNGLIMMRSTGYITYEYTPEKSGKYNLSYDIRVSGCYGQTFINGEAITEKTLYNQSRGYTEPIETIFSAKNTYTITFKAVEGEASSYFDFYNLKVEYMGEPDNGGEGIYYDLYAGDSVADNYASQNATSLKYGDGRGTNGWGCYGGLYTEFEFTVEYPGFYDINLELGAAGASVVTVSIDDNEVSTQNANYVSGEDWLVKRDNDFGQIFLLEGNHTLKIAGGNGTFMIFKARLSFDKVDDGSAELTFKYEAVDYASKGGSNVQTYTSPYGGVVLGEGGSYTEYIVDVPAGNYAFEICYGANNWDGQMSVTLNGAMLGTYALPQNNTSLHFANYDREAYFRPEILCLNEGVNKIKLRCEKFPSGSGYAYFSFTTFRLVRITEPVVQLYHGEYITPGTQKIDITDGVNTLRTYLPSYLENQEVLIIACLYKNGEVYKISQIKKDKAEVNDVLITAFEGVEYDETADYKIKVFCWNNLDDLMPHTKEINVLD